MSKRGQQVSQTLAGAFPGIQANVEEMPGGRTSGTVVWDGFTGHDFVERQQMIRNVLQAELGAQVQSVGVLLTYTTEEQHAMLAA